MNIAVAYLNRTVREKLCAALRSRGLQVFSVVDVKGILDAAKQAKLCIALVDTKLLLKERLNIRLQVQAAAGYPLQVVAMAHVVDDEIEPIFQRHGATMLDNSLEETAVIADWVHALAKQLSTSGRDDDTGGHWVPQEGGKGALLVAKGSGNHPSILVVEDEPTFRSFLCEALGDEGYTVWSAPNAEDAVKFFKTFSVELVISDINMPGMDGFELKQQIDNWHKSPVPFLMMTADSNAQNAESASAVGVVFIMAKPIRNIDALYAIVRETLRKAGVMVPEPDVAKK